MANKEELKKLMIRSSDDLCLLAEMLGYKDKTINQLQCNNGAFVSSLLNLLDDNPDLMETIKEWCETHLEVEKDEDEPDEYMWECLSDCKQAGDHLKSCDNDGYCKACGENEEG